MTDLETALIVVSSVLGLCLLCTCCCCCKKPANRDVLFGDDRRRKMAGYKAKVPRDVSYTSSFWTNPRGMLQHVQRFVPADGTIKAVVCFCHGYGDNTMWMGCETAGRLASAGYAVHIIDHIGHGLSDGMLILIENFPDLANDANTYFSTLREQYPGKQFFLYGESMGGAVALQIHLAHPADFAGAVFMAPMCKIADKMRPPMECCTIPTLKFVSRQFPAAQLVPSVDLLAQAFRDPARLQRCRQNPLTMEGKPRLATGRELHNATLTLEAALPDVTLPFVIFHGDADTVTDPEVSKALYNNARSSDKKLVLYPGMWHALTVGELPENIERVFKDMIAWLDEHIETTEAEGVDVAVAATPAGAGAGAAPPTGSDRSALLEEVV